MNPLPKEILEIIYSHLSQKSLARCGLVCRTWHAATRLPKYYFTIRLTNDKQLTHFIETATTSKINDIPIGYFVRYLYLEDLFNTQAFISITKIQALYKACPSIEYIDTLHGHRAETKNGFPQWNKLTHINSWVTIYNKSWFSELVMQQRQEQNTSILPTVLLDFFEYDYNNKITKMNHKHHFSFYNNNNNEYTSLLSDATFFLSFTSNWYHLTNLFISFEYSFFNGDPYTLNDHTFESIHQSCPSLESLTIKELELSISEDYLLYTQLVEASSSSSLPVGQGIKEKKLTSLHLINCIIIHSSIFNYLVKKYPHLSTLELRLEICEEEDDQFSTNMYHLISGLYQLKHLFVTFEYIPELSVPGKGYDFFQPLDDLFPHEQFKQWLLNHHQLETLEYPYDFDWPSTIKASDYDFFQPLGGLFPHEQFRQWLLYHHQLASFDYPNDDFDLPSTSAIKPLDFPFHDLSAILDYAEKIGTLREIRPTLLNDLFFRNEQPIQATTFLTSLIVHGFEPYVLNYSIMDYLNTFPNLKVLDITYANLFDYPKKKKIIPTSVTIYKLEKLVLHGVQFHFRFKINDFFNHFPFLKILHWTNVSIYNDYKQSSCTDDSIQENNIYIDLTSLDLDEIRIKEMNIDQHSELNHYTIHSNVIINEVRDGQIKNTVSISSSTETDAYKYKLQIDCKSVGLVQLK